jgi:hypothetical protein
MPFNALNPDFLLQTSAHSIQTGIDGGQVYFLGIDDHASRIGISIGPEVHIARQLMEAGKQNEHSVAYFIKAKSCIH